MFWRPSKVSDFTIESYVEQKKYLRVEECLVFPLSVPCVFSRLENRARFISGFRLDRPPNPPSQRLLLWHSEGQFSRLLLIYFLFKSASI